MRNGYLQLLNSPRPNSIPAVRKFSTNAAIKYIEDRAGRVETRKPEGEFAIEFQNSDRVGISVNRDYELVKQPFSISGVGVPVGSYDFTRERVTYNLGQQRPVSGNFSAEFGTYY